MWVAFDQMQKNRERTSTAQEREGSVHRTASEQKDIPRASENQNSMLNMDRKNTINNDRKNTAINNEGKIVINSGADLKPLSIPEDRKQSAKKNKRTDQEAIMAVLTSTQYLRASASRRKTYEEKVLGVPRNKEGSEYSAPTSTNTDATTIDELDSKEKPHPLYIYYLACSATVGGALFGYNTGVMNGANLLIQEDLRLEDATIEQITSAAIGSAAVFSLVAGFLSDFIGRKPCIMISALICTLSAFIMGFANDSNMLMIGRIVAGASVGFVSVIIPIYVAECAPVSIRGVLLTLHQLFITIGILLSSIAANIFESHKEGWRYMLGLSAIPGVLQFLFFLDLPESPRYQVMRHNIPEAQRILKLIRATKDVIKELDDIVTAFYSGDSNSGIRSWKRVFQDRHTRYALFIGCMLQFFQQACGINTIIYYIGFILKSTGLDVKRAIRVSTVPLLLNVFATFIGIWAVEKVGRTRSLFSSFIGVALSLLVFAAAYLPVYIHPQPTSPDFEVGYNMSYSHCMNFTNCWECVNMADCGFCGTRRGMRAIIYNASCVSVDVHSDYEHFSKEGRCSLSDYGVHKHKGGEAIFYAYGYCPSMYAWVAAVGSILYVLAFAPGAGPMPWVINAEIYPLWCRSAAFAISTCVNWTSSYIVSFLFLTTLKATTSWEVFTGFAAMCVIGAIFVVTMVPETRGWSLEDIHVLFMTKRERARALSRARKETESVDELLDDDEEDEAIVETAMTERKSESSI